MKLYKISGSSEYVDWDVLHNQQGYSTSATNPVTWKSSLGDTWGETVADGYMEPTAASGWATKGFCLGKIGWHNMDDMANIYYVWPDVATSAKARHATWGESDVAVWDYDGTHTLYLVQKELEEGWMDEDTFAERGWEIVPDVPLGELVFVDASGAVVYSVESLNEMEFAPTGYFTIEDADDVVFVEESPYPIVCQYSETHYGEVQADAGVTLALPYYTQKLYLYEVVAVGGNVTSGWEIVNDSGFVKVVNRTGAAVTAVVFVIRLIDATDASIVDVEYISTGFRASAFKWSSGGMDYYFIPFYEEATGWTDDLSAIGWQEVPSVVLPMVSVTGDFGTNNWLYRTNGGTAMSIAANSQENLWNATGSGYVNVSYDTSKAYAVVLWYFGTGSGDKGQNGVLSVVNNSGDIAAKNNTSSSVNLYALRCAVCSDSAATVITVYDSGNTAYNAFKFTASGTDYYYVLDGTQADWTDDLAGIGYSLTPATPFGYFTANGEAETTDKEIVPNTYLSNVYQLFDKNGNTIPYDSTKTYSFVTAYNVAGSVVTIGSQKVLKQYNSTGTLGFALGGSTRYYVFRIEYTVS